jgi:hypothetical protein
MPRGPSARPANSPRAARRAGPSDGPIGYSGPQRPGCILPPDECARHNLSRFSPYLPRLGGNKVGGDTRQSGPTRKSKFSRNRKNGPRALSRGPLLRTADGIYFSYFNYFPFFATPWGSMTNFLAAPLSKSL